MSRHTAAPWTFLEEDTSEFGSNASMPLTICGPNHDDLASVYSSADATVNVSRAEAIANARLIASAPNLLECLKAFVVGEVAYMTINNLGDPEQQHNVKWARSIIARAEGRS